MILWFLAVLIDQGIAFALQAKSQTTATTNISMLYIFSAMPIGGMIMLLVGLELVLRGVIGLFDPQAGIHTSDMDVAESSGE